MVVCGNLDRFSSHNDLDGSTRLSVAGFNVTHRNVGRSALTFQCRARSAARHFPDDGTVWERDITAFPCWSTLKIDIKISSRFVKTCSRIQDCDTLG